MPISPLERGFEGFLVSHSETELPSMTRRNYSALLDNKPIVISTIDMESRQTFDISSKMEQSLGYTRLDWTINTHDFWQSKIFSEDRQRVMKQFEIPFSLNETRDIEYRLVSKSGRSRWVRDSSRFIEDSGNKILQTVIEDIDEEMFKRKLFEAAKIAHETLELDTVLTTISDQLKEFIPYDTINIMLLKNGGGDEIGINFAKGYNNLGLPDPALTPDTRVSTMKDTLGVMLNDQRGVVIPDTEDANSGWIPRQAVIDKLGQDWLSYIGVPLIIKDRRGNNHVIGFLNLNSLEKNHFSAADLPKLQAFTDQIAVAVENARLHREITNLSLTDALTGLPNRRDLEHILKDRIAFTLQHGLDLGICYFDLDMFGNYNDIEGREAGDTVLINFTNSIRNGLRKKTDFLGRWSEGEEFMLIFDMPSNIQNLVVKNKFFSDLAQHIQSCLMGIPLYEVKKGGTGLKHTKVNWKIGDKIPITACIGVVSLNEIKPPTEKLNTYQIVDYYFNEIINLGDARAKAAKRLGRNRGLLPDGSILIGHVQMPNGNLIQPDILDSGLTFSPAEEK